MTTTIRLMGLGSMVASLAALAGCGGASFRVVEKTAGAGVVAIPNAQDAARDKAEQYMKSQCPAGYDVQKEAEAVIGETTKGRNTPTFFGANQSSTTTQKTEWRIEYKCKDSGGAAPAAPTDQNAKTSSETHVLFIRY